MADVIRRTIAELGTLYSLEPTLRDIFVEGPDDLAILKWYVKKRLNRSVSVLEIASVDVSASVVEKHELENGNRGRLLALALEMDGQLSPESDRCFTAVYDQDRDSIGDSMHAPKNALPTDFSCIEMYLLNTDTIEKFAALVLMNSDLDANHTINALGKVLVRLWVIKAANHMLHYGMTWIAFDKCCSIDGIAIRFDEEEFVQRYLMANGRLDNAGQFSAMVEKIDLKLSVDHRNHADGHHFYELARWYFRNHAKENAAVREQRAFERALTGCVDIQMLDQFSLFQKLLLRVA